MSEVSLSPGTAAALHKALGKAIQDLESGKNGIDAGAQAALDCRSRNTKKLELLQLIGTWLQANRFGKRGWLSSSPCVFLTLTRDSSRSYSKSQILALQGGAWTLSDYEFDSVYSVQDILARKSHRLPDTQTAHNLLDAISFDVIVKAWVIFAKEHDLQLPTDVTETPTGDFLLLKDRAAATDQRLR